MWIERLDERMDQWTERVPHLPILLLVIAAAIAAELVAFGWITLGQVERSHARERSVATLRSNIAQCYSHPSASIVDRCRMRVLAEAGNPQPGGPALLPDWRDDGAPVVAAARNGATGAAVASLTQQVSQASGIVPVSLMPGLR